jgi:DNA-binding PadR family transcriptional regulator
MKLSKLENLVSDFSRFYILTILYESPVHGYDIMSKFKARVGKNLSPGLIYPFLQQLEDMRIVSYKIQKIGGKERKKYYLTDYGNRFTRDLIKRFARITSTVLDPNINICAHCGCKVFDGAYKEELDGREMIFCCIHCSSHFKKVMEDPENMMIGEMTEVETW